MTRDETKQLLVAMQVAYPNYHPQDRRMTLDLWERWFAKYEYEAVMAALETYIVSDKTGFAPSPGQLIDKLRAIRKRNELTGMEAWSLVLKAIQNSGWETKKQYDSLPPDVQKAVGSATQLHNWATDECFNASVVMSHFLKAYDAVIKRREELELLPESAKRLRLNG